MEEVLHQLVAVNERRFTYFDKKIEIFDKKFACMEENFTKLSKKLNKARKILDGSLENFDKRFSALEKISRTVELASVNPCFENAPLDVESGNNVASNLERATTTVQAGTY